MLLLNLSLVAQESCFRYFPSQEGQMWTYKTYDKRNRLQNSNQNIIKNRNGNVITVQSYSFDKNGEPLGLKDKEGNIKIVEGEFDAICQGDKLLLNPYSFTSSLINSFQGIEAEISGDYVPISTSTMEEGDSLPDYSLKIEIKTIYKITIAISVYERYVADRETIETPAGTFNCWKISAITNTQAGIVNKNNPTYKNNGRVLSTTVLEDINW